MRKMEKFSIAANIRRLRKNQGMTQAQLARGVGVSAQTVSKWETETTLPDIGCLPAISAFFGVSIDELFNGPQSRCVDDIRPVVEHSGTDKDFLLRTYAQMYDGEAGPWNLSVENKYLEYRFAFFFEKYFRIHPGDNLCNIGIGAGAWDRYLAYQLQGGKLTSIDIDPLCCRQFREGVDFEQNPNLIEVVCGDVMTLDYHDAFEIVTMVGSTKLNSGTGLRIVEQVMGYVKSGGSLYYQSLDREENIDQVIRLAHRQNMELSALEQETTEHFLASYYKFRKI